jgi:hypothetical protein
MNPILAGIFALVIAAAGWFYLFYSKAAQSLQGIEEQAINRRRVFLRRAGGFSMILLAMSMYVGVVAFDWENPTIWFGLVWVLVMALVFVITLLALIDLRLTKQLRDRRSKREQP